MMRSTSLSSVAKKVGDSACLVERAIAISPPSIVGRQNTQTAAIMSTPLLREFVTKIHNIHPAINMYISLHKDTFPYFGQISEEVGTMAHITLREDEIDPIRWGEINRMACLENNARIHKNQMLKMIPSIYHLMDNANRIANTLFVRNFHADNNMSVLHSNYSNELPVAHGHNFTMDVHHAKRRKAAISASLAAVIELAGDLLRLINKFFCITFLGKYEVETFTISFYAGPNNEPITFVTDNKGRLFNNADTSSTINDPTNDRMINVKKEYVKEKQ